MNTYGNLCTEVYELSKPYPPTAAYEFYREYVKLVNGLVLEPMCGTGRFLLPYLEEGLNVHGFDSSAEMLSKLYAKAKMKNLKPNVWHGFIENLDVQYRYELIFIPSGSFCLMTNMEQAKAALATLYEHLTDSGTLLFEIDTRNALPELNVWQSSEWRINNNTLIKLNSFSKLYDEICSSVGKYDLIVNDNIVQFETEEYKIRIYNENDLIQLLKSVGFRKIRILKAFDKYQKPNENDESIVFECKK